MARSRHKHLIRVHPRPLRLIPTATLVDSTGQRGGGEGGRGGLLDPSEARNWCRAGPRQANLTGNLTLDVEAGSSETPVDHCQCQG